MSLAVVILVGAIAVAWLNGGTFGGLSALPVRSRWLIVGAALAQVGGGLAASISGSSDGYDVGLAVSAGLASLFCLRNLRLAGIPLLALGFVANAVVVGMNGAMPVSVHAAARAGVSTRAIAAGTDPRHTIANHSTALRSLGDVIPVPLPLRAEVVSPGDVLICAGLAELVVVAMRGRWRRRRTPVIDLSDRETQDGQASQALATMSRRS